MSAHMLTQIILTPIYLNTLNDEKFGILMIFLNIITFAVFGISWFSGGLVRLLGEYWSNKKITKFNETLILGKYVFTSYALLTALLSLILYYFLKQFGYLNSIEFFTVILILIYFILNYEALTERQAFVATNWQALGNNIEITKIIVFFFLVIFLLPKYKSLNVVFAALIAGVITQRVVTGIYLRFKIGFSGWGKFTNSMKPDLNQFLSTKGLNYFYFGTLVLLLQLDVVIIGIIGGPIVAGKFVLLWKIPEVLGLILGKIPTSLEPKIIHLDSKSELSSYSKFFLNSKTFFIIICFITSIFYILAGEHLVRIWVGENAPKDDWMYYIAGVALFFYSISRWPISFAFAQVKLRQLIKVSLIEFSFKIIFTLVLFRFFSYASPLIGMIIIHIIYVARGYQKIK
tara:strand:- start:1812 stop:3017 length:1206 start_codon:yes stop_codon:yes gene_type:complete